MKRVAASAIIVISALLAACAGQKPKTTELRTTATGYVAAVPVEAAEIQVAMNDSRADRSLDTVLSNHPSDVARDAIAAAVKASKIVNVQPLSNVVWRIEGELEKLDWFVPGYDSMLKKAFASSLLTGGLGGIAYGSTETLVQGNAVLKIRWLQSGREALNREYVGYYEEKIKKLQCDTVETKSRVAGLALSDAIEKLLKDMGSISAPKAQ